MYTHHYESTLLLDQKLRGTAFISKSVIKDRVVLKFARLQKADVNVRPCSIPGSRVTISPFPDLAVQVNSFIMLSYAFRSTAAKHGMRLLLLILQKVSCKHIHLFLGQCEG